MAYHGDKFLHIGAVTIMNNRDHNLHYAIEEEIKSRSFLISSAVGCYYFKELIPIQKAQKCFKLYGVYVSSVADFDRKKNRVTP